MPEACCSLTFTVFYVEDSSLQGMYGKYFKGTHVGKGPTPGYKFGADWWLDSDECLEMLLQ